MHSTPAILVPPLPGLGVNMRHCFPWLTPWATLFRRYAAGGVVYPGCPGDSAGLAGCDLAVSR